jgi:hypothetical protein
MPLARIRCASAKLERRGELWLPTPAECVRHGMDREADCGMSGELLEAMYGKQQNRGANISTTALIADCPRQVVLERRENYTVDPRRLYAAFRGEMAHKVQEGHMRPGSWGERRVWTAHPLNPGEFISCSPDRVDPDLGYLWDIKSSEELPKGHWKTPYPKHVKQLQINAFIIRNAEWIEPLEASKDGLPPLPRRTVMSGGVKWREFSPNPLWEPFPEELRPARFERLFIEYIAFEGSTVLECLKSQRVPTTDGNGTKWGPKVPDVWDDGQVIDMMEENYYDVKRGLDSLDDPVGYVPPVPPRLAGWPLDKRSPCNWCDVRPQCMQRELDEGLPSLKGTPDGVLDPKLLPAR